MRKILMFGLLLGTVGIGNGQDMLAGLESSTKDYTIATFKGTRLVNLHTIETLSKQTLEVRIAHRFAPFSAGANSLWGLDGPASIQLRLDYAPTDRLMFGVGRSSDQKIADGFVKYRLLRQTTDGGMPVSVTGLSSINYCMEPSGLAKDRYHLVSSRFSYMASVMVAKKFNSKLSVQLTPTYTHFNIVDLLTDKNDLFSLGASMRYKFSKRVAITAEYISRVTRYTADQHQYNDVLGIGFDIETGGHVFQVVFTNGYAINEPRMIAYTSSGIAKGLMLGFNISRVFSLNKK